MPERPRAELCHYSPGRIRLRIRDRRWDEDFFQHVKDVVGTWPGVAQVEVNPISAGVLVHFTGSPLDLAQRAAESGLFALDTAALAQPAAGPSLDRARAEFNRIDRQVRELTGGGADLRALVVLALLMGGIYQLFRGNVAAPAVTLLWYAGDALGLWRQNAPAQELSSDDRPVA
jgi:Heavy metal associated domain 2